MIAQVLLALCLAAPSPSAAAGAEVLAAPGDIEKLAETYVEAIEKLNAEHARKPRARTEAELASSLPKKARKALEELLELDLDSELEPALADCARAALDLDLLEDFDRLHERLSELSKPQAGNLGVAYSSERVLVIAEGGLSLEYAEHMAEVAEDVLAAYDELFGFEEFSKVPGKKLRLRVHLEQEITRPPHFAPQYAYHSEIDFPVIDPKRLSSPTAKGQFLFYGLCHELGHVIAMWGNQSNEEDHHAWAHYTGLAIVDHMTEMKRPPAWLKHCKDVGWRSPAKERARLEKAEAQAGTKNRDSVLVLLFELHDLVGPKAIGAAINALDAEDRRLRIQRVRYYTFRELEKALSKAEKSKKKRKALAALFD